MFFFVYFCVVVDKRLIVVIRVTASGDVEGLYFRIVNIL
jgi:hypothetical protein